MATSGQERHLQALRERHVGRLLLQAQRAFNGRAVAGLRARGYEALTLAHLSLLPHLDVDGTRATVLAERAGMSKQGAGQLVRDLERLGYLARSPDPRDGRAQLVTFTPAGLRFLADAVGVVRDLEEEYTRLLGADRLTALRETLLLIIAHDQAPPDEPSTLSAS